MIEILSFCLLCLFIIYCYNLILFIKFAKYKPSKSTYSVPVSIIICAKNEETNLKLNLRHVLQQEYKDFEVIVVNDQSIDGSKYYLESLQNKFDNLVVCNLDEKINTREGKKFALTIGIKLAKHENLLLIDADCRPNSKKWVEEIVNCFKNNNVILGYGSYEKTKTMLNRFIRYDTYLIAKQYFSFCLFGYPYMGVGRNLAYTKNVFFENKGFANHMHIASGDDDLFIQEVAVNNSVGIVVNENTHTISQSHEKWRNWIYQKRRHLTTSRFYDLKFKILLTIYPLSQLFFWLSLFILFFMSLEYFLILLLLKLLISYTINYSSMKKLNVSDLYLLHPMYEILYLFIQGIFVLLNLITQPQKWKHDK